ncbi:efflux RND transporter periplasmic adaptor subunit [Arenicella xantha]|uniref:RND family efflux transporter MFP subunit n=1 Tax=Arenicella xantha TaxID=644221 RepID=A0A395JIV7_9GAMM|nr:efflux RND transporter periplasmic adaptor subunit [Arenicella xantha]RBP50716.1 RND family efflux transporter MFP subunit [Arenicella xantha]
MDQSTMMYEDTDNVIEAPLPKWFHNRRLLAGFAFLVLASIGLAGYLLFGVSKVEATVDDAERSGPPPAPVAIAKAKMIDMAPHTVLPGTVISVRDAVIASETSGKILEIAKVGELLEANGNIATIDATDAKQMVAQRSAELARLQSLLTYHTDYFNRVELANNKLGVSEIGIAELRSNRDTARADVARAESALQAAQNSLDRTTIRAPFPGAVVSQSIQQGEYAQTGSPVVRLVDTINLEVSAQVPAALVQPLAPGTMLEITSLGRTFKAPLRALVPVGDSVSRTMELRVSLKDSGLLVGSPVRVSLPSAAPRSVVAIPRDAVILRTGAQYVYVVEEGVASKRDVELGYAERDMIEVIGEVSANDVVIIRGGERLRDGQEVSFQAVIPSASEAISSLGSPLQ